MAHADNNPFLWGLSKRRSAECRIISSFASFPWWADLSEPWKKKTSTPRHLAGNDICLDCNDEKTQQIIKRNKPQCAIKLSLSLMRAAEKKVELKWRFGQKRWWDEEVSSSIQVSRFFFHSLVFKVINPPRGAGGGGVASVILQNEDLLQ